MTAMRRDERIKRACEIVRQIHTLTGGAVTEEWDRGIRHCDECRVGPITYTARLAGSSFYVVVTLRGRTVGRLFRRVDRAAKWINQLVANPVGILAHSGLPHANTWVFGDDTAALVYADYLDERGHDDEAAQIREWVASSCAVAV